MDLKQDLKHLYNPPTKTVGVVDVPPLNYLLIDGEGDPNTSQVYAKAVTALYNLAYGIRAISKDQGQVFTVMPLEGLWDLNETPADFLITSEDKATFKWTMMIAQPPHITTKLVEEARETVHRKKNPLLLDYIRFETYEEGEAVQIMHIGPYSEEGPTVELLHRTIDENGWQLAKRHHEIYLSQPDRVVPEKMKTIIRQPFSR
ncbi:MAG: GyrI-like domain-containing protein [Chloroflexi bacterium]|nr:GyrI-like domain-containing protein [Chloroflexota bacterium]